MSWGYKILIGYSVFVAGILFMVFRSSGEKFDLVTDDYYGKELQFQQQIDAAVRTAALHEKVTCTVLNDSLYVVFPQELNGKNITGQLHLYYAADKTKDIVKQFTAVRNTTAVVLPAANKGSHRLFITWQVNGADYYFEENIFLQ